MVIIGLKGKSLISMMDDVLIYTVLDKIIYITKLGKTLIISLKKI